MPIFMAVMRANAFALGKGLSSRSVGVRLVWGKSERHSVLCAAHGDAYRLIRPPVSDIPRLNARLCGVRRPPRLVSFAPPGCPLLLPGPFRFHSAMSSKAGFIMTSSGRSRTPCYPVAPGGLRRGLRGRAGADRDHRAHRGPVQRRAQTRAPAFPPPRCSCERRST